MIQSNRLIWDDGGTLKDLSLTLNDFKSQTQVIDYQLGDYIYIGSDLPFNHRYFEVSVANALAATASVELWNGSTWVLAVDRIDQTAVTGVPLAQSGHLSWVKNKNQGWVKQDTDAGSGITGLSSLTIYDLYWARISYSAVLTGTMALKFVGQKFSEDSDLRTLWPDLVRAETYAQWPYQPKTTWDDQHYEAVESVVRELKRKGQLTSPSQILNWELFREASAHKTAELIMNAMGKDWEKPRDQAAKYFKEAIDAWTFDIDKNKDTLLNDNERSVSTVVIRR